MRNRLSRTIGVCLGAVCAAGAGQGAPGRVLSLEEPVPAARGVDREGLEAMTSELAARGTTGFIVFRDGLIVHEWYAPEWGPQRRHYTASLAKALVGGMSLMLALSDGRVRADDPAAVYIPAWREDPLKSRITLRHLATHSAGIENAEQDGIPHMELPGWKGAFWKREPDPFSPAIRQAPVIFEPGTEYAYSNTGMAALSYAITAAIQDAPQKDVRSLLRERIMEPIGIDEEEWSIGYGSTYQVDGLDLVANWGGGSFTPRAVARVGLLMLRRGNWSGRQLVDPAWVDQVTRYAGTPIPERPEGNPQPGSGLGWWTNLDSVWSKVPPDAFAGAGAGQQVLLVVPSLGLVAVRNGSLMEEEGLGFWGGIEKYVFNPLMDSIPGYTPGAGLRETGPYPPSPVIHSVRFADRSSIIRRARGSDNWPLTWADDDSLYTAYGDGWGFQPQVPRENKLSLGLARILGTPEDFQGLNIRSSSGERTGDGAGGEKSSGLLSVEGRLYMWVRNAGNSRLGWSDDHGLNWTWSDWRLDTSFGHPVFLNFGRDYRGARDDFVYVYSPDGPSAYEPSDHMVLARVRKDRVTDRTAYEFLAGFRDGEPVWSSDIRERGPVFTHPMRCLRSSVSYSSALQRYLWVQIVPGQATRFTGGLAIYDAPEPWGPWSTVYYSTNWDVGPGELAHLPTKWMSEDGRTMYLVFSGDDSFSVRRLDLTLVSDVH